MISRIQRPHGLVMMITFVTFNSSSGDNVPAFIDMVGQENNSRQNGFLYMVGQGLSREKAFVTGLGQRCFYNTKSQITEKVIGRLF